MSTLKDYLKSSQREEELKHYFAQYFELKKFDTANDIDLYTPEILFEFKLDKDLQKLQELAACFAQTLYYARNLKYGYRHETRPPTNSICVVTKNFAALVPTENFSSYYDKSKDRVFDWDLAPSSPCRKLVAALAADKVLRDCHVYDFSVPEDLDSFVAQIRAGIKAPHSSRSNALKKTIDEFNFYPAFEYWQKLFGDAVRGELKPSEYFITDIELGKSKMFAASSEAQRCFVTFQMNSGASVEKNFPHKKYESFWQTYEKVTDDAVIRAIRQKMDRMTEINRRRFTGEFFTPIDFAAKALDYLRRTVGDWWKDENFRLWDMAAGTGNLEINLPQDALPKCYISTLEQTDVDYCKKIFSGATVFQYDYLNDDVDFLANPNLAAKRKMPQNLVDDLKNPKIKWIIFINPPYAMPSNFEFDKNRVDKLGVSMTAIRDLMAKDNLGWTSQELSVQFLYRISREFASRKVWLGIFSKLTYLNSGNDKKFRENFFAYKYESGFVFSSKNFQGCKGSFPVGFLIWNLAESMPRHEQVIEADVFDERIEKVGLKSFKPTNSEELLNKWIKRPRCTIKFPPMSSALKVAYESKSPQNKISENFLFSFMFSGSDFSNQNYTAFLSGAVARHGGMSITPENFEQCMVIHAVRKIPKATWLNNRDQFMQPTKDLPAEFISDAVIWSLFAPSNQTASLRNVEYEGEIYQLKNNLYPYLLAEVKTWNCSYAKVQQRLLAATDDRFAALWLKEHRAEISVEGAKVLAEGRQVYKTFYERLNIRDYVKLKIEDWDAGWYQVRMSWKLPKEFNQAFEKLSDKLLPQIYELGFLRDKVKYF